MDIKRFLEIYKDTYRDLYNNRSELSYIVVSDYAVIFDDSMGTDPDFTDTIFKAVDDRGDKFTSDRECAAAVLAYKIMQRIAGA